MNLATINSAIDAAYADALSNGGQRVMPHAIAPNIMLQTDIYVAPSGSGFRVICTIRRNDGAFIQRVKNYGPDTNSEKQWPEEGIEVALQNLPTPFYKL